MSYVSIIKRFVGAECITPTVLEMVVSRYRLLTSPTHTFVAVSARHLVTTENIVTDVW